MEEQKPKTSSKSWVVVAEGCHSCQEILVKLKTFCKGKKASPEKMGFLISGSNKEAMLKKLEDYKSGYEIFAGSPGELYQYYKVSSSPALISGTQLVSGKKAILKHLKNHNSFCS